MGILKDIWRVGVVPAPVEAVLADGEVPSGPTVWLDNPGPLAFYADPFGIWRGDRLYLFVERYDYGKRHGTIEVFTLDRRLNLLDRRLALAEPWHLSYPYVFEHDGETYLLPEAFQSGRLTLYRADRFPDRWTAVARIELNTPPIDATPVFHEGRWWLFYAPSHSEAAKTRELHVAFADNLLGPWRIHPGNPVRNDPASTRPGGRACLWKGQLVLPVQDCTRTYGGDLRLLAISKLTPDDFAATAGPPLRTPAEWAPFSAMHTLSGAGDVTFVDAKRSVVTARSLQLDAGRKIGALAARLGGSWRERSVLANARGFEPDR
jgi:hypothetical protein